jgi:hypothetical protein
MNRKRFFVALAGAALWLAWAAAPARSDPG